MLQWETYIAKTVIVILVVQFWLTTYFMFESLQLSQCLNLVPTKSVTVLGCRLFVASQLIGHLFPVLLLILVVINDIF